MDAFPLLSQSNFFKGISAESRHALARICAPVEARKKEVLFREGDAGHSIFMLVRGNVRLHKTTPSGHEIVIKMIKPGEVFAEVILFEENRYPVTATALTSCLLLKILRRDIHALLKQEDFRNDFMASMLRKQRYLAEQIRQISSTDIASRLTYFLREQFGERASIELPIAKKDVAAAIGITPETLSRLLLKLKRRGMVNWHGRVLQFNPAFWKREL